MSKCRSVNEDELRMLKVLQEVISPNSSDVLYDANRYNVVDLLKMLFLVLDVWYKLNFPFMESRRYSIELAFKVLQCSMKNI